MTKIDRNAAIARTAANKARRQAAHAKRMAKKGAKLAKMGTVAPSFKKDKPPAAPEVWTGVLRAAFDNILMRHINFKTAKDVAASVSGALNSTLGLWKMGQGWNAHLSFKTAQKLKEQGILA